MVEATIVGDRREFPSGLAKASVAWSLRLKSACSVDVQARRMIQIGLRGTRYSDEDIAFGYEVGMRLVVVRRIKGKIRYDPAPAGFLDF
ncbi:MAG TPA: hypothetical protein VLQ80_16900 [Candidatus Saccharimonadia bacterium]|nr:hypothetical protein [Candidatus Saccharimonadia bacterium]